ncbi:MAG: hypothetical protein ACR2N7_07075 [Acidimicrobiia bacterium]
MSVGSQRIAGAGLVVIGIVVVIVGSVLVHMTEAPSLNSLGEEMFANVPRGWVAVLLAQSIAIGGAIMVIAGLTLVFVYNQELTWVRAMIGALLFTSLMTIIFAVIPNQMLTLFQSTLEWTPQKIVVTVPPFLVLNNEMAISYAALKDMIVAGYATTALIVIPVIMWQWQGRAEKADAPKPEPVSNYGRPMRVDR